MKPFDILIVGAGPAGSFAAERLAGAGVPVALFDGRPEGEPKACGGGVTGKALKAWPHLLEAVGRTVTELEMYAPSGRALHLKLDEPFAIYSRSAFDSYLLERARAAGAHVFHEKISRARIKQTDNGWLLQASKEAGERREWQGKFLVGADGANSAIGKMLAGPLPPAEMEVAFGYRAPLFDLSNPRTVVAFLPKWDGYVWAFPRLDHISFGIATAQNTFDHAVLDQHLWDFMIGYVRIYVDECKVVWSRQKRDDPRYGQVRDELRKTVENYAARIPKLTPGVWRTRHFAGPNWSLLGDAAGFADPITGEGIYYALRSAELFADAYIDGQPNLYEWRCNTDFVKDLCRAAALREQFFGGFLGAPFTQRMIQLAHYHFGIRRTLKDLVAGDQGYVPLKSTLIRRLIWPF